MTVIYNSHRHSRERDIKLFACYQSFTIIMIREVTEATSDLSCVENLTGVSFDVIVLNAR